MNKWEGWEILSVRLKMRLEGLFKKYALAEFCEHGNEHSGSTKQEIFDWLTTISCNLPVIYHSDLR
jgi:hypothetical protein